MVNRSVDLVSSSVSGSIRSCNDISSPQKRYWLRKKQSSISNFFAFQGFRLLLAAFADWFENFIFLLRLFWLDIFSLKISQWNSQWLWITNGAHPLSIPNAGRQQHYSVVSLSLRTRRILWTSNDRRPPFAVHQSLLPTHRPCTGRGCTRICRERESPNVPIGVYPRAGTTHTIFEQDVFNFFLNIRIYLECVPSEWIFNTHIYTFSQCFPVEPVLLQWQIGSAALQFYAFHRPLVVERVRKSFAIFTAHTQIYM